MPYIYFLVSLTLKNLRFNEQRSLSNAFPSPLPWLKLHANFSQISQKISSDIKEKNKKKICSKQQKNGRRFIRGGDGNRKLVRRRLE